MEKARYTAVGMIVGRILKYVDKNPDENILKLVDLARRVSGGVFPQKPFDRFRSTVSDPESVWSGYARAFLRDVDLEVLRRMTLSLGLGTYVGTKAVRKNREKHGCNIPYIILLDPTSACNKSCKGCWSAEYGHQYNLSCDDMESIVSQGAAMGSHIYMLTGGEPLIRRRDIFRLCEAHPDCTFLAYTNATLVDEEFCRDMNRVGNLSLAISIEGSRETTDGRRGEGSYDRCIEAMRLLKKNRCLFGMSVCYTRANVPEVTSDEFMDKMITEGVKFALYFNYMPVGRDADVELIPTPQQREHMYKWLRRVRDGKTGKPMFLLDFQNDAEYVGGCIAGGRNYFHVNSAGDIEPCVFVHYSDSNIHRDTLIEALKKPLFQAFYKNQPFNDNHLRPCPFLENPQCLKAIVNETGAKSTDLLAPEAVETLCARCESFAGEWEPRAKTLWESTKHPNPKTQYYRDRSQESGVRSQE